MSQFYRVTVKHDEGKDSYKVLATDAGKAAHFIQLATGCPLAAIIKIKEVKS